MIWPVASTLFGLVIGSFLNVCIYRIPRGESIIKPGSHCPYCLKPIRSYDNIPVLSYILLGGRCRYCGARISPRYPLVEIASAVLALAVLYRFGPGLRFIVYYAFSCSLLVITFIDLDHQMIPNSITLGGIIAGIVLNPVLPLSFKDSLLGLVLGSGTLLMVIYGYLLITGRQGMGGGDVKLLGMIGIFTGWQGVVFTILISSLIGSITGITWIILTKKDMKAAMPFGPFLSLGAIIYIFWGHYLINAYLGFINPG